MNVNLLRRQLLEARDVRAAMVAQFAAALPEGRALVFLSLNVPGPSKNSPRLDRVFQRAREALAATDARRRRAAVDALPRRAAAAGLPLEMRGEGRDALGPWLAAACPGPPHEIKRHCIALEESLPAGRLVDLDVYDHLGRQVDRRALDLPTRRCLICSEAAVDCMRTGRHSPDELARVVDALLRDNDLARMADALVEGARIELELTPKPGLVDRRDNGSHPDLSFDLMERSIALLPEYYDELISLAGLKHCSTPPNPAEAGFHDDRLAACIAAGRRAEERMLAAIGTNAHRGYIFLSGLVLLGYAVAQSEDAAADTRLEGSAAYTRRETAAAELRPGTAATTLSSAVAVVARRLVGLRPDGATGTAHGGMPGVAEGGVTGLAQDSRLRAKRFGETSPDPWRRPASLAWSGAGATGSHGEAARLRHRVGGVIGEALEGLPSVFRHALPTLERAEERHGATDTARHAAMATLMTVVDDTTTLHRCGAEGLQRLRQDGRRILEAVESDKSYVPLLEALNEKYRAAGMTMGGVADCLAITIAIRIFQGRVRG